MRGLRIVSLAVLALLLPVSAAAAAVVSWGQNVAGLLGAGYASFTPSLTPGPVLIPAPREVLAGPPTALLPSGAIMTWGNSNGGQLADGTQLRRLIPTAVGGLANVKQVAGSAEHGIALLGNGTVETWGNNIYGQLGIGTDGGGIEACKANCRSLVPVPVPGLAGVNAVFAGGADDAVLLKNGTVMAWGENRSGQVGDGTTVLRNTPTPVRGLANVKTLALGGEASLGGHMLALLNDGTVEALGQNNLGQLGIGSNVLSTTSPVKVSSLSGVTAIAASWTHSLALVGGKLFAWGSNGFGEIGAPARDLCGHKPCANAPVRVPLQGVSSFSAGFATSYAVAGSRAYSWGHNKYGQLGDGSTTDRFSPGLVTGLEGVTSIEGGEAQAFATITGAAPPPIIEVKPGLLSLSLRWRGTGGTSWFVVWRPYTGAARHSPPFGPKVWLPASARSYTVTGLLPGQSYEVAVQQLNGSFGRCEVEGTAGP